MDRRPTLPPDDYCCHTITDYVGCRHYSLQPQFCPDYVNLLERLAREDVERVQRSATLPQLPRKCAPSRRRYTVNGSCPDCTAAERARQNFEQAQQYHREARQYRDDAQQNYAKVRQYRENAAQNKSEEGRQYSEHTQQYYVGAQQSHAEVRQYNKHTQQYYVGAQQNHAEVRQYSEHTQQYHMDAQQNHAQVRQYSEHTQQYHVDAQQNHVDAQQNYAKVRRYHEEVRQYHEDAQHKSEEVRQYSVDAQQYNKELRPNRAEPIVKPITQPAVRRGTLENILVKGKEAVQNALRKSERKSSDTYEANPGLDTRAEQFMLDRSVVTGSPSSIYSCSTDGGNNQTGNAKSRSSKGRFSKSKTPKPTAPARPNISSPRSLSTSLQKYSTPTIDIPTPPFVNRDNTMTSDDLARIYQADLGEHPQETPNSVIMRIENNHLIVDEEVIRDYQEWKRRKDSSANSDTYM